MKTRNFSAFGASLAVHVAILAVMALIRNELMQHQPEIVVDSIFTEREQEEFTQQLDISTEVATTLNPISGGVVSTEVGAASEPVISQTKIETSETLQDPQIKVNVGDMTIPGDDVLGTDLGEKQVAGDPGAFVEGYGPALGRITQELIRLMREQKVLVVWMFDQSESMKDDQIEIRDNFHKVYEELGLVTKKDEGLRRRGNRPQDAVLLTSVMQFCQNIHELTPRPTDDVQEIKDAIDKIEIDESGHENACQAIAAAIDKYRPMAQSQKRKLVVVVVTDESGKDGHLVEETLARAQRASSPIYFLGREAIFGYPYGRIRWKDPKYGLTFWLRIDRGPETPFPECLQWDGLRNRHDAFSSGFGPYEHARLSRETGGIFFILPGEEEDLAGAGARLERQYRALDMKEYLPSLAARREYAQERDRSRFRKTIWDVVVRLNPNEHKQLPSHDPMLNIRQHWYPLEVNEFRSAGETEVVKAVRAMMLLNEAIPLLESVRAERARESSQRWRANYDLALAQCVAFRVRLFQYLLAMDEHANNMPPIEDEKSNRWDVRRTRKTIEPSEAQFDRLKQAFNLKTSRDEYLAMVKAEEERSTEMYRKIIDEHPGTPWAVRADWEIRNGFGMQFHETYYDPRRDSLDIKLPNP